MLILHIFNLASQCAQPNNFLLPPRLLLLWCSLPQRRATKTQPISQGRTFDNPGCISGILLSTLVSSASRCRSQKFCPSVQPRPPLHTIICFLTIAAVLPVLRPVPTSPFYTTASQVDFLKGNTVCLVPP